VISQHTTPSPARLRLLIAGSLLSLFVSFVPPALAGPREDALARMDKAAVGFRGLSAGVRKITYTALIQESTEESGTMTLFRPKPRDLRMLIDFNKPEARAVAFQGKKVQLYNPKLLLVQEYDLGKQGGLVEQFLLLGFGTPGSELAKSYAIKHLGEETIHGVKTDHLDLTPNSAEALKAVRHIEIWVSQADGITVQQKVHQPSKDYLLIQYSDLKVNPALTEESVRLKLPKGVKKETPQK